MMKRVLFFAAIAVLFAAPAYAASIGHYPHVLVDDGCTDSYNAPGTYTQAQAALALPPAIQTSGSADVGCDHDARIRETALVADTTFGPFKLPAGATGIIVFADSNIVSNDTDTWAIEILRARPVDRVAVVAATSSALATESDHIVGFGPDDRNAVTMSTATEEIDATVPSTFWIRLNLGTATSWDGTLSWAAY
jgi:hypothetical protein